MEKAQSVPVATHGAEPVEQHPAASSASAAGAGRKRPRPTSRPSPHPSPASEDTPPPPTATTTTTSSTTAATATTAVVQTPHTLRLLRLAISGTPTHSIAARSLLSDLASHSSAETLWDLLGRLVVGAGSGSGGGGASNTGLYSPKWVERHNAAGTIGSIAVRLPRVDRRGFLADERGDGNGTSGNDGGRSKDNNEKEGRGGEEGLWLRVDDLLDDTTTRSDDDERRNNESEASSSNNYTDERLNSSKLDTILQQGRLLLSSSGEGYDCNTSDDCNDEEEERALRALDESAVGGGNGGNSSRMDSFLRRRVRLQRQILARRLGLGGILSAPVMTTTQDDVLGDMVDDADLVLPATSSTMQTASKGCDGSNEDSTSAASQARRRNMERRNNNKRRRHGEEASSSNANDADDVEEGVTLRALLVLEMRRSSGGESSSGRRAAAAAAPSHRNPQTLLATDLLYRTFDADWTVRHGALMGILALVKSWMAGLDVNVQQQSSLHNCFGRWPHDILARCLCILALDRFGDYSGSAVGGPGEGGDRVVAPVRETAAQLLSLLLPMAPESAQTACYTVLHRLVRHDGAWEVRHGAMLAFKYVAALWTGSLVLEKEDRSAALQCRCWDDISSLAISGLSDESDDIRGTSAQVLACYFRDAGRDTQPSCTPLHLDGIVEGCSIPLWSALLQVGAVSSCAVDILSLFANVMAYNCDLVVRTVHSNVFEERPLEFASVLRKLADFLSFDDAAVKLSSLRALGTIVRPMVEKAIAHENTQHDDSLLLSISQGYCGLVSDLFATYFRDNTGCIVNAEVDGNESAATADKKYSLFSARDDAWAKVIDAVPLLLARNTASAHKARGSQGQIRDLLFRLLSSLILRFVGIERGADLQSCSRIGGSLETLDEKFSASFSCQRAAAAALAQLLCLQLGLIPSKEQGSSHNASSNLFLASLLRCLVTSPWPSMCEASCIFFAALGDAATTRRIENPAVFQCRQLFTSMLVDSPLCIRFEAEQSASILRDPSVINACDLALISMLDTNAKTLGHVDATSSADELLPVTSDQVFELFQGIFRAKGLVLPVDANAIESNAKGCATKPLTTSSMRLSSSIAGAAIAWNLQDLPIKLTPIIRPLMTSLKNEEAATRLDWTCLYLSRMLSLSPSEPGVGESPVPSNVRDKILFNVCTITLADTTSSGQSSAASQASAAAGKQLLRMIARDIEGEISEIAPFYVILTPLKSVELGDSSSNVELRKALSLLLLLSQSLQSYTQIIDEMLPAVIHLACASLSVRLRKQAIDVATVVCKSDTTKALRIVLPIHLKYLKSIGSDVKRLNACQLLQSILDATGTTICPFVRCLLPVAMSLMTDPIEECARLAAGAFASLVRVSPLVEKRNEAVLVKSDLDYLMDVKSNEVIDHLIHGEPLPPLCLPSPIQACLRKSDTILRGYQQEGIAWMHFLQCVNLNGALCDDMGLGKTLQALIVIALAHSEQDGRPVSLIVCPSTVVGHWMNEIQRYFPDEDVYRALMYTGLTSKRRSMLQEQLSGCNIIVTSYSVLRNDVDTLSSLPWAYCVLDEGHLLKNPKSATAKAARRIKSHHKLILTGTPVQNNVNELWAVFDFLMPNFLGTEAAFTKSFAKPIINGQVAGASPAAINLGMNKLKLLHQTVLPFILRREKQDVMKELPPKVITDMPCVLSQEQATLYRQFIASSEAKHALTALQRSMHLAYEESGTRKNEKLSLGQDVFKSLLYLRLLCTHPLLVVKRKQELTNGLDPFHNEDGTTTAEAYSRIECSGKLVALKDLLQSASICSDGLTGADSDQTTLYAGRITADKPDASTGDLGGALVDDFDADGAAAEEKAETTSKCLIFAQFTQSLDIVEDFLFAPHMPSLRYLRIDGQVAPEERTKRVDQFNEDESIKVMLLTTRVGGLGLNLTGADTVIFLEHDWNPFSDLQAMDRTHRIGQTKTVNVYRLISSDTIEEKIMKLQSIKMEVSKAIVNSDNSTMYSMGTDRLLDIFTFEERNGDDDNIRRGRTNGGTAQSNLLSSMSSQEEEYSSLSTESFLQDLLLSTRPS